MITPLPDDPEVLGYPVFGSSFSVASVRPVCACGRVLGVLEYDLATSADAKRTFEGFGLKICCRNEFMSRTVHTVVSNDLGAYHVETKDNTLKNSEVLDGLPPTFEGMEEDEVCLP